jgi:RNA polymerase sigma-70 factor (ECF subfamily)
VAIGVVELRDREPPVDVCRERIWVQVSIHERAGRHASLAAPVSVALLMARLEPARQASVAAIANLASILDDQYAAGAAAWPAISVTRERYIDELARRINTRASEPADRVLTTMPAADLYIAIACNDGDPGALAAFRDAFIPALRQTLAKLALAPPTIDETVQRVLVMLFVDGQIAGFGGKGTLRSWVRSIGVRTGRRLAGHEHDSDQSDDELAALPGAVADPELELLRHRYGSQVSRAFAAAFAQLTERERNVLRQYHIDGLTIDQLAALYQVNRATTARWVAGARLAVVAKTRNQLVEQFGIAASEVDSIIRLVRSQLAVSVRDLNN